MWIWLKQYCQSCARLISVAIGLNPNSTQSVAVLQMFGRDVLRRRQELRVETIRRLATNMVGVEEAIRFNGETLHMDIWEIIVPSGKSESMTLDGVYWGEMELIRETPTAKHCIWTSKFTSVLPPHDHPDTTEHLLVIEGCVEIVSSGLYKRLEKDDWTTFDPGIAHQLTIHAGTITQTTWTR